MRFITLDTFRGFAALIIILFHSRFHTPILNDFQIIEKGELFVDFFFVLSGFVITHSSKNKLKNWSDYSIFIQKRFWRLYPLHLFTLFLILGYETLRFLLAQFSVGSAGEETFFVKNNTLTFISNLTLTQALGFFNYLSWNIPSWSISAEFYTYIIWGGLIVFTRKRLAVTTLFLLFPIAYFITTQNGNIVYTYNFGLFRCIYGFSIGFITYLFFDYLQPLQKVKTSSYWSMLEVLLILFIAWALHNCEEKMSWLMPLSFSIFVLTFAFEKGNISRILLSQRFSFFGKLSYSYYLNHNIILLIINLIFYKVIKLKHFFLTDCLYLAFCLIITHFLSTLTYKYIEKPFLFKKAISIR